MWQPHQPAISIKLCKLAVVVEMYSVLSSYLNIPTKYSLLAIYKCSFKTVWPSVQTCSKNCLAICTCSKNILPNNHVPKKLPGHLYMLLLPGHLNSVHITTPWPSVHVPTKVPGHLYKCTCSYSLAIFTWSYSLAIFTCSYSLAICTCSYKSSWSSVHVPTKLPGHLYMFLLPRRSYMFLIHDPNPWSICTWVLPKYNVYMFLQNWLDICSSFYNLSVPVVVKTAWRFVQVPTIYPSQLW